MAEGPRNDSSREEDAARLRDLEERLSRLNAEPVKNPAMEKYNQANLAWRMVTELVAGLGLGFGVGFGLDYLFGTKPFLMVLFIFLGLAAGVKTMMRTAGELNKTPGPRPDSDKRD